MGKKLTAREKIRQSRTKREKRNPEKRTYDEKMNSQGQNREYVIAGEFDLFKPESGTDKKYKGDIIPYIVGKNPSIISDRKEGEDGYVFMYKFHSTAGGEERICLEETYGQRCPDCEHRKQLIQKGEHKDVFKHFYPRRNAKCVYNFKCRSHKEEQDKGVQIWIANGFYTENIFDKLKFDEDEFLTPEEEGQGEVYFYEPDETGRLISFDMIATSFKTGDGNEIEFDKIDNVRFKPRKYEITDEELESAYCLEDLVQLPRDEDGYIDFEAAYEKNKASLWGEDIEQEEDGNNEGNEGSVPWDDDEIIRQVKEIRKVFTDDKFTSTSEIRDLVKKYSILSDIDADRYDDDLDLWEAITDKLDEINIK